MSAEARAVAPAGAEALTAVVTALPEELAPLRARVSGLRRERRGARRFLLGRLGGRPVVLMATGMGPARAERELRALVEAYPVTALIGAGLAGALSPELEAGELLVARQVRDGAGPVADPDPSWVARALGRGNGGRGVVLVTVGEPLWSTESKAVLLRRLSPPAPTAVDTESSAWARVASEHGIPYLIVRSLLDPAEEGLPALLARCQDRDGALHRGRVVAQALLHPHAAAELLALRRQVHSGTERLARFVEDLLASDGAA
jgi:nucleoside phosphorylase